MNFNIRNSITPGVPLMVMYCAETNQLGISSEGWPLVAVCTFIAFVKHKPDPSNYRASQGRELDYVKHEGVVDKTEAWDIVGEF